MTFDWSEYLKLAQQLAGQDVNLVSQEAKLRSSVSRSYYAAYHKALNYLTDIDKYEIPRAPEAHKTVRELFQKSPNRSYKKIGSNLDRLGIDRIHADYRSHVDAIPGKASMALILAQKVITEVETLQNNRDN